MNNREIKFRGLEIDSNTWVFGDLVHREGLANPQIKPLGFTAKIVDAKTVGQLTGLKDKNGVDIYESDALKHEAFKGAIYVCEFSEGAFLFREYHEVLGKQELYRISAEDILTKAEVIGNIHSNPELLK